MNLNLKIQRNTSSRNGTKVTNRTYRDIEEYSIETDENGSTLRFILTKEHYEPHRKKTFIPNININLNKNIHHYNDRFPNASSSVTEVFDNLSTNGAESIISFIHNSGYDKYYHLVETDRSVTISYKYEDTDAYHKARKTREDIKKEIKSLEQKKRDAFFNTTWEEFYQVDFDKYDKKIGTLSDKLHEHHSVNRVYKYKYLVVPKYKYTDTTSPTSKHLDAMNNLSSKRSTEVIQDLSTNYNRNKDNPPKTWNDVFDNIANKISGWF